jgi:NADPH-dependent glutamate synthase beta subunit-like oxidoreductase
MLQAIYLMGGLGLLVGICLAAASKIFYVYVDPKILAVEDLLPGANCGGCGLPGCSSNAEAIVAGKASPNSCVAAGPDTAQAIAGLLGVAMTVSEPDVARPGCYYSVSDAESKFEYLGLGDCRAAALLSGGMKVCSIGCLGLGTCARACPFGAITMGPDGLPVVSEEKCTGCGTCERVCPKHIITLSSVTRRIMREYTTDECTTPCQRGCPAGIDIREYIRQIGLGDYRRAVQVIKERNPFPTVIGRICPHPCEEQCRRQYVDEPVGINNLKRFVADYERNTGSRVQPYKAPETGRRVAVAGGGISGLSTAFFTVRLGHGAVVYEVQDKLGGLLRSAIASARLPMEILDWDVQGILEMGVTAETGKVIGRDMTISSLLTDGFDAVYLATGGWDSRSTRKDPAKAGGPVQGMQLLIDLMRQGSAPEGVKGRDVVIVGAGPLAMQAAEKCRAMGAGNVTTVFNQPASQLGDMSACSGGDETAVCFNTGVHRILGIDGDVTGADIMDLSTREIRSVSADLLILEAGRFPELIFTRIPGDDPEAAEEEGVADDGGEAVEWQAVIPYKKPAFMEAAGLFSPGDAFSDFSAAIKAIGAGRRAAASIHQLMNGMVPMLEASVVTKEGDVQNVDQVERVRPVIRQAMPISAQAELSAGEELEKGYTEDAARAEARRCLQCGLICYQRTEPETSAQFRQVQCG